MLLARQYIIDTDDSSDLNTEFVGRLLKILSVSDTSDDQLFLDAKDFLYTECGVSRRCYLRSLLQNKVSDDEALVLSIVEFIDLMKNVDVIGDDTIYTKVLDFPDNASFIIV